MSTVTGGSEPLRNRKILVACSAKKMAKLASGLEKLGGNVFPFPVIETREIEDKRLIDNAIASLRKYDWIIFTSAYGVEFFMRRMKACASREQIRGLPKVCAVGPATAAAVKEFGHEVTLVPGQYVGEGILKTLADYYGGIQNLAGLEVLLPRALDAREFLPRALAEAEVKVDVVPCYRTVRAEVDPDSIRKLRDAEPDLIVFTSSSTIHNLMAILGEDAGRRMLAESAVAVIGPITAGTAAAFGKRADIVPKENTISSLLEGIREYYRSQESGVRSQEP